MATHLPRPLPTLLCCAALFLPALAADAEDFDIFAPEDRAYWAFQPIRRPTPPRIPNARWARNPIDAFILSRLLSADLTPAAEAGRGTLIRRACFDLHGLPPTPEQVRRFLEDERPDAYERLIDRLLASPRYGERWARHWLDLVRYAETDGYNQDAERPHAWRYRDYVITALNDGKPYDRFIMEQVAGDEIAPDDPAALTATGFLRHGPYEFNQRNVPQQRMHILNDLTDVAGQVFLGLTVRCARCHDHKFDAILQEDYYRLQAFFAPLVDRDEARAANDSQMRRYERRLAAWRSATENTGEEIAELEVPYREEERRKRKALFTPEIQAIIDKPADERTPHEKQIGALAEKQLVITTAEVEKLIKGEKKKRWDALRKELAKHSDLRPRPLPTVMTVNDVGREAPPTIIPGLGELDDPDTHVPPGFLWVLDPTEARTQPTERSTGRRTALARWLTRQDNPLVARVMVNRLWHHHFRRGLVATPNDLGRQGTACTHPELLDWLASQFIGGWSLKRMHRLMMTSATYRQASLVPRSERAASTDPDNKLLWRMRTGRLEAEVIRDAMLAASGELNPKMAGKSVYPELPQGISVRHAWKATPSATERNRRSVYLFVKRNLPHPLLDSFDLPDPHESCARRQVTTTAPQALILLNGKWSLDRAAAFAGRLLTERDDAIDAALVARAYQLAYSRRASREEIELALAFLKRQASLVERRLVAKQPVRLPAGWNASDGRAQAAALVDLCHALLNSNEFIYVD